MTDESSEHEKTCPPVVAVSPDMVEFATTTVVGEAPKLEYDLEQIPPPSYKAVSPDMVEFIISIDEVVRELE